MPYSIDDILKSIGSGRSAFGIGTAAAYLNAIAPCLAGGDGLCPTKVFDLASGDAWKKEIAEAGQRLVWCGEDSTVDLSEKSISEGAGIANGAVLEYDATLISRRKDRDGDILEPKDWEFDAKMPLLWQHIQVQPIGKHIKVLSQDEHSTTHRFAIADTELGRDAATLVKFGALRKSHGFKPSEFEPIEIVKGADGQSRVNGWHIKRGSTMEGSVVSIPSNVDGDIHRIYEKQFDGLCTALSREKLHHPLVKNYAQGIYEKRPKFVQGFDLQDKSVQGEGVGGSEAAKEVAAPERYSFNDKAERWFDRVTKKFVSLAEVESKAVTVRTNGDVVVDVQHTGERGGTGSQTTASRSGTDQVTSGVARSGETGEGAGPGSASSGVAENGEKRCPACGGMVDSSGTCSECGAIVGDAGSSATGAVTNPDGVEAGGKSIRSLVRKGDVALITKMMNVGELEGSWEWIERKLQRKADAYLMAYSVDTGDRYVYLIATFESTAILCVERYSDDKRKCYRVSWSTDDDGMPKFTGEPTEVEIKQQIIEKRIGDITSKAFSGETLDAVARMFTVKAMDAEFDDAMDAIQTVEHTAVMLRNQRDAAELDACLSDFE